MPLKIRKARFWTEMLALAVIAACAFALFSSPGRSASAKSAAPQSSMAALGAPESHEGMVTDTRCGAKHSATIGLTASDCTRVCVHSGEHFALVDGDTVYALEGESGALKLVAGERVRVTGTMNGNKISVASVVAK